MFKPELINNHSQLESAHLDWYGLRTQLTLGLITIFCLCLTNFLPLWQNNLALLDFILYFSSCLIVALITLELTGRFGNRIRASCALWAAFVFCVFPWQIVDYFVTARLDRLLTMLILLSAYSVLRVKSNRLAFYILLLLVCALGVSRVNNHQLAIFTSIDRLFLPGLISKHALNARLLELAYLITAFVLLARILRHSLKWQALSILGLCLLLICFLHGQACSYAISWTTLAAVALAITVSLTCLPGLDIAPAGISRSVGCFGLVALVIMTIIYEQLFLSYQNQILNLASIRAKHPAQTNN